MRPDPRAQTGGRKGEAMDLPDISRSTLWRKMREYRIGWGGPTP
ncbi:MAG: helix-turn-helix domain-containing protein [Myxococcota bacterium]